MPLDPTGTVAPPRRSDRLYRWLSAPILIAVVVAFLVNFIIPRISEKSENHRRSLEIKTDLVSDISRSATDAIISSRFIAGDVIRKESGVRGQQRFYDAGLREWETKSSELQAHIDAYFPRTALGKEWRGLATAITDLYTLSGSGIPDRTLRMNRIRDYLATHHYVLMDGDIDWDALVTDRPRTPTQSENPTEKQERNGRENHFRAVYKTAGDLLLRRTDAYVTDVLSTDVSGF